MFSKDSARDLQDALITLFRDEYGRQPRYNRTRENHSNPAPFIGVGSASASSGHQIQGLTGKEPGLSPERSTAMTPAGGKRTPSRQSGRSIDMAVELHR